MRALRIFCGLAIALVVLTSCSNDAITFAHLIEPTAECTALHTVVNKTASDTDTAVCRVGTELLACEARGADIPTCRKIADVKIEAPVQPAVKP